MFDLGEMKGRCTRKYLDRRIFRGEWRSNVVIGEEGPTPEWYEEQGGSGEVVNLAINIMGGESPISLTATYTGLCFLRLHLFEQIQHLPSKCNMSFRSSHTA